MSKERGKISFSQALSLHLWAARMWWNIEPKLFISNILLTLVSTLSPFETIYCSARIIDILSGTRNADALWKWVGITLAVTAISGICIAFLKCWVETLQSLMGTLNYDLRVDMSNMYHVNLERDDACSMLNSVELRLPFLDKNLIELVLNIPDNKKIVSMHDEMRKSILRKLAFEEGLDYEIAYRPKKAAQYGTGIDKILRKKIIKNTDISQYL